MSELEESKQMENLLFKRKLTKTPTPPPPYDNGGQTDTPINPNPDLNTSSNKTVFNSPKGGSMNPTQTETNVTDESNRIPSQWELIDEKRGIYRDQFGNYGYDPVGPPKPAPKQYEQMGPPKPDETSIPDPYFNSTKTINEETDKSILGKDPTENKTGEILGDSTNPIFFNDDKEGGLAGRLESTIEGIAGQGRDFSALLFEKASNQNILKDYGAIPTVLTAGAVRFGVGVLEGVTFPIRPLAWKNTVTTILTAEGRAGIMESLKSDMLGFGLETVGSIYGGKLATKGFSKAIDTVKGPKGEYRQLTEAKVINEFTDLQLIEGGKYGQGKVLTTTIEPTQIIKKDIPRKAFKTITELNENIDYDTILGYSEDLKRGVEIKTKSSVIDQLLEGKKVKNILDIESGTVEIPASYVKPFTFIDTIKDQITGVKTKFLNKTQPADIFKEIGSETAFTNDIELKPYLKPDTFKMKVSGGLKFLDETPETPTTPIKPNPIDIRTSLNKTFGFGEKPIVKTPTPSNTPKVDLKILTTKTTGQNGIPLARFRAVQSNYSGLEYVSGFSSIEDIKIKAGIKNDMGVSEQLKLNSTIKPIIKVKPDTDLINEQKPKINSIQIVNPSYKSGERPIVKETPITRIKELITPDVKPVVDVKPITIVKPIYQTKPISDVKPVIGPIPPIILNPKKPKTDIFSKRLTTKPKRKKSKGLAGAEYRTKGVQTPEMIKKRLLKL